MNHDRLLTWKRDVLVAGGIFLFALVLRAPLYAYPPVAVVDEGAFVSFISSTVRGEPFFEVHPPLGWLYMTLAAHPDRSSLWPEAMYAVGQSFGGFPYERVRLANVILGSLLVVVIYAIARVLGFNYKRAAIPALLAALDNALVLHSRIIMPDSLFLLLGFSGILAFLCALKAPREWSRVLLIMLSGILFGLVISVKWTGLGFFAAAAIFLLYKKLWKDIVKLACVMCFTYIAVFVLYFSLFHPGPVNMKLSIDLPNDPATRAQVSELQFPRTGDIQGTVKSFLDYNRLIYLTHTDKKFIQASPDGGKPFEWPFSFDPFVYWGDGKGVEIGILGNFFSWGTVFVAVMYYCVAIPFNYFKKKIKPGWPLFLLAAYLANYLPFFLIPSQLFLFHYLAAVNFGYLLVPFLIEDLVAVRKRDTLEGELSGALLIGAFLMFLAVSKFTYGF